ncbi:MAG TPA: DUF475 domain-containing protein [Jatrophihabitans sp.]|nr:DUF475 domain-containing protein [Jatrophihabitans sp.]
MFFKTFGGALGVTVIGLVLAFFYGGTTGLAVAAILGVLEVSVSFDNAVVNATYLGRLNDFWQKMFLTVGVLIAVFGMRLLFPVIIVCLTAKITPAQAYHLAMNGGSVHTPGTYANLLQAAHPAIAAFGGMFLLMLFLEFVFEDRELTWLSWLERPLARIGKLDQVAVAVAAVVLVIAANTLAPEGKTVTVLMAGIFGLVTYLVVNGLGGLFEAEEEDGDDVPGETSMPGIHGTPEDVERAVSRRATARVIGLAGKAAFGVFLYLEVLDATFSFDGVIGAFAITSDPIIIAIGLGIGAMYIRSLTVFLVRRGTLSEYVYLEHGALWAIGALAVLLLITIEYEVPEVVTGLIGAGFIGAAFISSLVRNRRSPDEEEHVELATAGT